MEFTWIEMDKKKVGRYYKEIAEYRTTRKPEQFFMKYCGFGISQRVIDGLETVGCKEIIIHYKGIRGNETWRISFADFKKNGLVYNHNGDVQLVVSKKDWQVEQV